MRLDTYATDAQSSTRMMAVRIKNTERERLVRHALRALGLRYQLQRAVLPGTPDVVVPSLDLAVFVHGCFWHHHACRKGRARPTRNEAVWQWKSYANTVRDRRAAAALRRDGLRAMTFWECQLKDLKGVQRRFAAVARPERRR